MLRRVSGMWLPCLVTLALANSVHAQPGASPLKDRVLKEYRPSLTDGNNDLFDFKGPDADQCVKFEATGLRITLPAGFQGARPETGLRVTTDIRGDFEITMSYEVLQEPEPQDAGIATRTMLGLWFAGPEKAQNTTFGRVRSTNSATQFSAWAPTLVDKLGNKQVRLKYLPAESKSGRVRLVRLGTELLYYAADGNIGEFVLVARFAMSDGDVKRVRVFGTTGGPQAALDVRITDLQIRAESFPDLPAALLVNADNPIAAPPPQEATGENRLRWIAILGGVFVLALAIAAVGVWFVWRRSRAQIPEEAATEIAFECTGCNRRITVRRAMAGRKVKCAQCNAILLVPLDAESTPEASNR